MVLHKSNSCKLKDAVSFEINFVVIFFFCTSVPGPNFWDRITPCWGNCSSLLQSPININTGETIYRPFRGLKFLDLCGRISAKIRNNGKYLHKFTAHLNIGFKTLLVSHHIIRVSLIKQLILKFFNKTIPSQLIKNHDFCGWKENTE